mmetsp:Transcript_9650/g.13498  ORF Transcript_9650/g.13498 Transcript_9650/m.13498 type:complete len:478 (-) Transcript_9650:118-1551(-)|eukprot:CAMPEP_0185735822 /NCGR_PEP_ID=MMETSP1171-20130828/26258_1 /TAXON_ID=374046 /ORGANISM="Helicotheca tamensis, Strain CCMP826" /LENGTH=477 /DNA_ID=CAMNT_0028406253 /DNA_START=111 /DNA_END=1544 /DNA_ORIENTATION=+
MLPASMRTQSIHNTIAVVNGERGSRTRRRITNISSLAIFLILAIYSPQLASALSSSNIGGGTGKHLTASRYSPLFMPVSGGGGVLRTGSWKQRRCQDRRNVSLKASAAPSAAVSSSVPRANLAVSLDRPLLSPDQYYGRTGSIMWKSLLAILLSDVFKAAIVAFCLAFGVSLLASSSNQPGLSDFSPQSIKAGLDYYLKVAKGRATRLWNKLRPAEKINAVPMPFSEDDDGWGVCTLRRKERIGRSPFVRYDFDLPRSDYVLPLSLGQTITMCCLDDNDNISEGNFYTFKDDPGAFSIVLPEKSEEETEFDLGVDRAKFTRVLKQEMEIGDEVAIKPGDATLNYRGQYLPVTDIVYVASGVGIVPIVDQVKAVLPSGSSSVKTVSLAWINENGKDFDIAINELEEEYFKYNTKLAVSCIGHDVHKGGMEGNDEISEAVPDFVPGTMAVVSGPGKFSGKAKAYLIDRGYPEDCICVMT